MDALDEYWQELDKYILKNRKLKFIQQIRAHTGCSVSKAIEMLGSRYEWLRKEFPDKFQTSAEEYWSDFNS
ncbi:hypothetical protein BTA51_01100 [Hahella sp. CCB-MM4]|nr:hypothetical protein BTA51_01100 [Hahella sp. CCB-MM4]